MPQKNNILVEENVPDTAGFNLLKSKLVKLGKDYFDLHATPKHNLESYLKDGTEFYSLPLSENFKEYFIEENNAAAFWLIRSPLIHYIEDFLKFYLSKGRGLETHKNVLKFYIKWLSINSVDEKKYFANSVINYLLKEKSRHNFYYNILYGVILSQDPGLFNPLKAVDQFKIARNVITSLNIADNYKKELFYLIDLYSGFAYLKLKNYEEADKYFNSALNSKPSGITAKYYLSITGLKTGKEKTAVDIISDIFKLELSRLEFATDKLNFKTFDFLIKKTPLHHIFYDDNFVDLFDQLELFFNELDKSGLDIRNQLLIKTEKFGNLHYLYDYFNDDVIANVSFVGKIVDKYKSNNSILFLNSMKFVKSKFNRAIEIIIQDIEKKYYNESEEALKEYDLEIKEHFETIERLRKEQIEFKSQIYQRYQKSVEAITNKVNEEISLLEKALEMISLKEKNSANSPLKNMMTYVTILSLIVFTLGAFAGYTGKFSKEVWEFKNFIVLVIGQGFRWSVITFVVGSVLAFGGTISIKMERASKKNNLKQRISSLKDLLKAQIEELQKDLKQKEISIDKNFNRRINGLTSLIEKLKEDKKRPQQILKEKAEIKINEETVELRELMI